MPEPGVTIGRYEVLRRLGEGGMAVVHLARQEDLQRFVALKELRALHADDPSLAQRFLREARLAGSLTDPHVVTVYEYFEHDGTPYLAMEYLERGSLRPYIGDLNLPQLSGVLEAVLAALVAAERAGIVHRDLKPENVLVTADGRVKIADFGIAKASSSVNAGTFKTSTGMMIGTPAYMAPEQAMAEDVGPWTDLYSVGCLAFELFTGKRPFHDVEAPMAILMRHATEPVPPVASIVPDVDPRISAWISRLLEKDRTERTPSAAVAWDEYEEIVLDLLGPRWRRDARLVHQPGPPAPDGEPSVEATARPYTPPPPDLPPGPLAPAAEPDDPGPGPASARPRSRLLLALAGAAVLLAAVVVAFLALTGPEELPTTVPADDVGNVIASESFESGLGGWQAFQGTAVPVQVDDAPDGSWVARVQSSVDGDQYALDDEPDVVEYGSVAGRHYTATAWVKATESTDGKPVCIAIRQWSRGRSDGSFTAIALGRVTASAGEYRQVSASYVATADGDTIAVHIFRWADDVTAGEAFLVDDIRFGSDDAGGPDDQRVDEARCA